jgi:hypothetical protein
VFGKSSNGETKPVEDSTWGRQSSGKAKRRGYKSREWEWTTVRSSGSAIFFSLSCGGVSEVPSSVNVVCSVSVWKNEQLSNLSSTEIFSGIEGNRTRWEVMQELCADDGAKARNRLKLRLKHVV